MANRNIISIDTEFLSHGGVSVPLQIGYSQPVKGRRQHTFQSSRKEISDLLTKVYNDLGAGNRDAVRDTYAMAKRLQNVPTAIHFADAIEATVKAFDTGMDQTQFIGDMTESLHKTVASQSDLFNNDIAMEARKKFAGKTVVGANFQEADRGTVERAFGKDFVSNTGGQGLGPINDLQSHSASHPAVQMFGQLNPNSPIGSGDQFSKDLSQAFNAELRPRVEGTLRDIGIDPTKVNWGSHVETESGMSMSTGTRSLGDSYLITGGRTRHGASMPGRYGELGLLSPGISAHGAGFDAALGASIGNAMENLSGSDMEYGADLVVASRVYVAADKADVPITQEEALLAVQKHARKGTTPGPKREATKQTSMSTAKKGSRKAGSRSMSEVLANVKMPKSLKGFTGGKIGIVAAVGAGAVLAAYQAREVNNTLSFMHRQGRSPSHMGSDKVAMAMALGG